MNQLGERNCYMISRAFKSAGYDPEWAYCYIEEDLYIHEAKTIHLFMKWICDNEIPCTENTLEGIFQSFLADNEMKELLNTLN